MKTKFETWRKLWVCYLDFRAAAAQFSSLSQLARYAKEETKKARRTDGEILHRHRMCHGDSPIIFVPIRYWTEMFRSGHRFYGLVMGTKRNRRSQKVDGRIWRTNSRRAGGDKKEPFHIRSSEIIALACISHHCARSSWSYLCVVFSLSECAVDSTRPKLD
jgi:hypothetical protein